MKLLVSRLASVLLALVAVASVVPSAHAQTGTPRDPYVITAAPYTISKPGYYILGNNLSVTTTSGNITVGANNVTLDFNGFYIAGPNNTASQVYGVRAAEKSNLTVKNGTVAFCYQDIVLEGSNTATTNAVDAIVDNMRVTNCFYVGIYLYYCPASRVTNCQVSQIGLSGRGQAFGIDAFGGGMTVQNNTVSTVTANNSYGIYVSSSIVRQNSIINCVNGIFGGKYQDNLTINCETAYSFGTDAGGNN